MIKFLNVDDLLISLNGIVLVEQTSATATVITYADGLLLTLTHASTTAPAFSDALVAVIARALSTDWQKPVYNVGSADGLAAISGAAATHVVVPATA